MATVSQTIHLNITEPETVIMSGFSQEPNYSNGILDQIIEFISNNSQALMVTVLVLIVATALFLAEQSKTKHGGTTQAEPKPLINPSSIPTIMLAALAILPLGGHLNYASSLGIFQAKQSAHAAVTDNLTFVLDQAEQEFKLSRGTTQAHVVINGVLSTSNADGFEVYFSLNSESYAYLSEKQINILLQSSLLQEYPIQGNTEHILAAQGAAAATNLEQKFELSFIVPSDIMPGVYSLDVLFEASDVKIETFANEATVSREIEYVTGQDNSNYVPPISESETSVNEPNAGGGPSLPASITSYTNYNMSLDTMAGWQFSGNPYLTGSYADVRNALDPAANQGNYIYQFADLRTYSGLNTAQLNAFIDSTANGRSGMLHNLGAAFVTAAQTYNVNEAYLLAHAILESGWGQSTLAWGYYYNGWEYLVDGRYWPAGTYHNFYGIGAYDSSPLSGGRALAIQNGWNSPSKAVIGAANWINTVYVRRHDNGWGDFNQFTLYKMKWDIDRSNAIGNYGWNQYATGYTWARTISLLMSEIYQSAGITPSLSYNIPVYR